MFVSSGPPSITANAGDTPEMAILSVNHNWRFATEPRGPGRLERMLDLRGAGLGPILRHPEVSPPHIPYVSFGKRALSAACVRSGPERQFITHDKWLDVISSRRYLIICVWLIGRNSIQFAVRDAEGQIGKRYTHTRKGLKRRSQTATDPM